MKVSHAAPEATLPVDMEVSCSSSAGLVELLQLFGSLPQFGRFKYRERGNGVCTPTSTCAAALAKMTPEYENKSVMDPPAAPSKVIYLLSVMLANQQVLLTSTPPTWSPSPQGCSF